jgi:hypothetical protein
LQMTRLTLSLLSLCALASAAPAEDEVTSLPGWKGALPSKMYSGFIESGWDVQDGINRTMQMWYMFVEAEGFADPTKAPTALWSNGGPGASSAFGLFTELGPFTLSSASLKTDPPTLFRNEYSWTKLANVLILNGPAPVGFSYCTPAGPSGSATSCGSWNDTRTAEFNVQFVTNFFAKKFPEYAASPFYVTGESCECVCVCVCVLACGGVLAHSPLCPLHFPSLPSLLSAQMLACTLGELQSPSLAHPLTSHFLMHALVPLLPPPLPASAA